MGHRSITTSPITAIGPGGTSIGNGLSGQPIEGGLFNPAELALDAASAGLLHYGSSGSFGSALGVVVQVQTGSVVPIALSLAHSLIPSRG